MSRVDRKRKRTHRATPDRTLAHVHGRDEIIFQKFNDIWLEIEEPEMVDIVDDSDENGELLS